MRLSAVAAPRCRHNEGPSKPLGRRRDGEIDAEGRIEKVFTKVDTANHYRQILDAYK